MVLQNFYFTEGIGFEITDIVRWFKKIGLDYMSFKEVVLSVSRIEMY